MSKLPDKLYYVKIVPGGKPLKFRQKGSGTYTDEEAALAQYHVLKGHGCNVKFYALECNWEEIPMINPMDGEPTLW